MKTVKICFVGSKGCGKKHLLHTFVNEKSLDDDFNKEIEIEGEKISCVLHNTSGEEEYDQIRKISYTGTNCFIFCVSMKNAETLKELKNVFYPEIYKMYPRAPIILLGLQSDSEKNEIDSETLKEFAQAIGATKFFEIPSKDVENVKKAIESSFIYGLKSLESETFEDLVQNETNVADTLKRMENKIDQLTNEVSELKNLVKILFENSKNK